MKFLPLAISLLLSAPTFALNEPTAEKLAIMQELAAQGEAKAQYALAEHYHAGFGLEQNLANAFQWYKKAAEQNHLPAMFNLATAYDLGEGTEQNLEQAAYWYEKAARLGEPSAAYNLGILYDEGAGVKKDPIQASIWLRLADLLQHELAEEALQKATLLFAAERKNTIEASAQALYKNIVAAQQSSNE